MNKACFVGLLLSIGTVCSAELLPLDPKFVHAIGWVESKNNPNSVGDGGRAIGEFQIWKVYWMDAIQYSPKIGGEYKDCYNPDYALKIMTAYLNRYAKDAIKNNNFETLARVHNGGPMGYKKSATKVYWLKVKDAIDKLK
jgi:soluble lytic murein transglycosylase-like protein